MNKKNRIFLTLSIALLFFLLITSPACQREEVDSEPLPPIDSQQVQDQDLMTWDDYRPIPGRNWADPSLKPEGGCRTMGYDGQRLF